MVVMEEVDVGCNGGEGVRGWWSDLRGSKKKEIVVGETVTVMVTLTNLRGSESSGGGDGGGEDSDDGDGWW